MLDIRKIKENPDAVKAGLKAKEVDCDAIIDKILELDVQVRGLKTSTETKTAQKNKISKENGKLFGMKKGLEKKGEDCTEVNAKIADNVAAVAEIDASIEGDKALLKDLDAELYTNLLARCSPCRRAAGRRRAGWAGPACWCTAPPPGPSG